MRNTKTILKMTLLSLGLFLVCATDVSAEVIKSFDATVQLNLDSSVSVMETILYDTEGLKKHGIYRDITPMSSTGKAMSIKDISVIDTVGNPYQWREQSNNGNVRLKIGDPNITFQGEKVYVISYRATNAVAHLVDKDEIYWNVTGNNWPFAILQVTARVLLPSGVQTQQSACYYGPRGSTTQCDIGGATTVASTDTLAVGEGMTIAVGFEKGTVIPYVPTMKEKIIAIVGLYWPILIPLSVCVYMFQKWYRIGRDAKGRRIIIPEYEIIDNITPLQAAVIINQSFNGRAIIAEILSLAVREYISITQTETKKYIGKNIEYTLTLTKVPDESLQSFDKQLLEEIFDVQMTQGSSIVLSNNQSLSSLTKKIETLLNTRLVEQGYYTTDFIEPSLRERFLYAKTSQIKNRFFLIFIGILMLASPIGIYIFDFFGKISIILFPQEMTPIVCVLSLIVTIPMYLFFKSIMPAKTIKGTLAREHLLGLKEYIRVAEKDRIAFHNAPEMKPELFETLLPYAILFGFEKKWVKVFEGITIPQPSWYISNNAGFVATSFLVDFSQNFSSSFFSASASSGSGSGGSGSSGGGGGGGGGGSW